MANRWLDGVSALLTGYRLVLQPGIRSLVLLPLAISLGVYLAAFWYFVTGLAELGQWVGNWIPGWLPEGVQSFLFGLLFVLAILGFGLMVNFSFVTLANVLAAPFLSFLAEAVLRQLGGLKQPESGIGALLRALPAIMGRELHKLLWIGGAFLLVLLLSLIPVLNLLSPLYWFLFGCWSLSLQYLDFPADLQQLKLKELRRRLNRKPWQRYSFGAASALAAQIPVLNILLVPASVAGACWLWCQHWQQEPLARGR